MDNTKKEFLFWIEDHEVLGKEYQFNNFFHRVSPTQLKAKNYNYYLLEDLSVDEIRDHFERELLEFKNGRVLFMSQGIYTSNYSSTFEFDGEFY